VLATFALILIFNEVVRLIWGTDLPLNGARPRWKARSSCPAAALPGLPLLIIAVGLAVALLLYVLVIQDARRACWCAPAPPTARWRWRWASTSARLFTLVFGARRRRCARWPARCWAAARGAGGHGRAILILAFVVIVIGGIGSIRGALLGALLVGIVDTVGRTLLPTLLREFLPPQWRQRRGPALASIADLPADGRGAGVRPQGLFPARGG
jgi:branched-chain amino acid transport system permease protein